jgi:hypothetical protein
LNGQGLGLAVATNPDPVAVLGSTVTANPEKVVVYLPDSIGCYSETRTLACHAHLTNTTTLIFRIEEFHRQFPVRFDPCQCPGLIMINSFALFDALNHRVVWELGDYDSAEPAITGTAVPVHYGTLLNGRGLRNILRRNRNSRQPLTVISTGQDPQLILPVVPSNVGFPLIMSIEMKLVPYE